MVRKDPVGSLTAQWPPEHRQLYECRLHQQQDKLAVWDGQLTYGHQSTKHTGKLTHRLVCILLFLERCLRSQYVNW